MVAFERDASTLSFRGARSIVVRSLPDDAQVALSLMVFQLGPDGALEFHAMLKAIASGDWERTAAEALDSAWAKETPRRAEGGGGVAQGRSRRRLNRCRAFFGTRLNGMSSPDYHSSYAWFE